VRDAEENAATSPHPFTPSPPPSPPPPQLSRAPPPTLSTCKDLPEKCDLAAVQAAITHWTSYAIKFKPGVKKTGGFGGGKEVLTMELDVFAPASATTKEFHYHTVMESKFKQFVPLCKGTLLGVSQHLGVFAQGEVVRNKDGHLVLSADIGGGSTTLNHMGSMHFGPHTF
jgi:hypothetical protein